MATRRTRLVPVPPRRFEAEWLDAPGASGISHAELAASFRDLRRLDRVVRARERWRQLVVGCIAGREASVLEVGTGAGDAAVGLYRWSMRNRYSLRITGLDVSPEVLAVARETVGLLPIDLVEGNALSLPFPEASFDVVANLGVIHHFSDEDAVVSLSEMWRVTRRAVVVVDLERSYALTLAATLALHGLAGSRLTRRDGLVTVRRAYTLEELRGLGIAAGLENVTVRQFRPFLQALVATRDR